MEMADDSRVRVMSRSIVKASVTRPPAVVAVSNLDLLYQGIPVSLLCVYRKPSAGGGFRDVVAAFEAKLPSLLGHFFPLAGRIVANPRSGLPELQYGNQGAELVLGEVGAALGSLDYGDLHASLARVGVPVRYAPDVALSVQLLSFACGGFAVAWGSPHVVLDGHALCLLASAWSELARSGTIAASSAPNHDRSVLLRPRAAPAPSYRQQGPSSVPGLFMPLVTEHLVNALTARASFVGRTYYVEERDLAMLRAQTRVEAVSAYLWKVFAAVVGTSDEKCRMGWWVNGRRRLAAPPGQEAAMRNYVGSVTSFAVAEAGVDAIQRRPLPEIASMMRESIRSSVTDEHFRELADWVEEHKGDKYVEAAIVGLGSPVLAVTSFASFGLDTDFGFGQAALALPTSVHCGRLCCGFVQITPCLGGGDGSWIFTMFVWPRLAAALEADEQRIFKPLTAEYLGVMPANQHSRL